MALLIEPLHYRFFLHGLAVALLVGSLCGLLGVYIVLRQMSYIGHGLAHAVFGGAVASFLLNLNFYIGAGVWGLGAMLLIDKLAAKREITRADIIQLGHEFNKDRQSKQNCHDQAGRRQDLTKQVATNYPHLESTHLRRRIYLLREPN